MACTDSVHAQSHVDPSGIVGGLACDMVEIIERGANVWRKALYV